MKSQGFDRRSRLIGDVHRLFELHAAQQYGELLAPDSRDEVAGTQRPGETPGNALQYPVARPMSVAVVDDLETVDVPQQHDHGSFALRPPRGCLGKSFVERFAIGNSGQWIKSRNVLFPIQFGMQLPRFVLEVRDSLLHL